MTKEFGNWGEEKAAQLLLAQGYTVVARNYRTKLGEIDLVATKGGGVWFVEVKTRHNEVFGGAAAAVTKKKLEKIRRVALQFMAEYKVVGTANIGVVAITGNRPAELITEITLS